MKLYLVRKNLIKNTKNGGWWLHLREPKAARLEPGWLEKGKLASLCSFPVKRFIRVAFGFDAKDFTEADYIEFEATLSRNNREGLLFFTMKKDIDRFWCDGRLCWRSMVFGSKSVAHTLCRRLGLKHQDGISFRVMFSKPIVWTWVRDE